MATVSTPFKRLLLRSLNASRSDRQVTLDLVLMELAQAKIQQAAMGVVLIGTSSNGSSSTFTLPGRGVGYSPSDVAECIEELITSYEDTKQALIDGGNATPTEDEIFRLMLSGLQSVTEWSTDYSEMRRASW